MHLLTTEITPRVLSELSVSQSQNAPAPPQAVGALNRTEARPVVRTLKELRMHPALEKLGWAGLVEEFNDAVRPSTHSLHDPILIAADGTVLAGFGRWRLAVFEQRSKIYCIEHSLSADDSLAFILAHHQTQRGWNAFVRIRLALTLKPHFQQRALDNMRAGGKLKGLANLPDVQRIDVRREIADIAGVCPRNVGNVETILKIADPTLITALGNGTLKINRAMEIGKLPHSEQLEEFIRYSEEKATSKVIRRCLARPRKSEISLDAGAVLEALNRREQLRPGSFSARIVRNKRTVILVGQDLLAEIMLNEELPLK